MNKLSCTAFVLLLSGFLLAAALPDLDPVPKPVTNNAITTVRLRGNLYIYSLVGIGESRTWNSVASDGYVFDNETGGWTAIHPIPGGIGRIAAMAASENGRVFLMGGSIVDPQGHENPVPDLNIYAPDAEEWLRGADLPVGVADAVVGNYRDRIYLIGGRSRNGAASNVQVYDAGSNSWENATPLPGVPTYGAAGAIVGDMIVYVDGATSTGTISDACWMGKIERKGLLKITWTKLPPHPGTPGFRITAGGSERDNKIYFVGGTPAPTNYEGKTADGKVPAPSSVSFAFNVKTKNWEPIDPNVPHVTMDNHVLVATEQGLVVIGGTEADGKVTAAMRIIPKQKTAAH
jgi:N-acetylneuraminic acid mutarotase